MGVSASVGEVGEDGVGFVFVVIVNWAGVDASEGGDFQPGW